MDIHKFDGKLIDYSKFIQNKIYKVQCYDLYKRKQIMLNLYKNVEQYLDNVQKRILMTIINDDGKTTNYDWTNNLRADDLLILISEDINISNDFIDILKMKLTEMETGFCPQGRCIRLFQLYMSFLI